MVFWEKCHSSVLKVQLHVFISIGSQHLKKTASGETMSNQTETASDEFPTQNPWHLQTPVAFLSSTQ